jgi:hypothetical protein
MRISSQDTIKVIKLVRLAWAGHAADMEKVVNTYTIII